MYSPGQSGNELLVDPHCITWIKGVIQDKLAKSKDMSLKWTSENQKTAADFLLHEEHQILFAFVNNNQYITTMNFEQAKKGSWESLIFFLKDSSEGEKITLDNIASVMSFGILTQELLGDFLVLMKNYFAPDLIECKTNWPESSTVLYVPIEEIDIENARNQKDLVQRLEAALMHWTTQIKEVVSEKDSYGEHGDNARPLSEIEYWRSRADDLINIKKQIQREDVQKIVTVLSGSSYLTTFEKLSTEIQKGSDEALDNLKFLRALQEPCERLASCEPSQIIDIVPEILWTVQLINANSNSYNTSERISGLLKKISNEIIHICTGKISLTNIFNGNVEKCMETLHQSIRAGEFWKRLCLDESDVEGFNYDKSSVFSEIDAFVVRCGELLEVCEAQLQFGCFSVSTDNSTNGLPNFGGTRGPEITKSLVDIRISFQKLINDLSNLKYPILDVKSTNWHDDYKKFKNGIKDLETMMNTIISNAFETVTDIQNGIELLEAFSYLAKRESIRRSIDSKTQLICLKFIKELEDVQKIFELNRKNPPIPFIYPSYSGSALWAKRLQDRIKRDKMLLDRAHFLTRTKEHTEVDKKYQQVYSNLEKHILSMFEAWSHSFQGSELHLKLEIPLLTKKDGLLSVNFDPSLLNIFEEVKYWQRFSNFDINAQALELYCYADKMRLYRENVMLVARDYNSIVSCLSQQEARLFVRYIKEIDKQILPGLHTLGWTLKMHNEHFISESRKKCKEVKDIVTEFKTNVTQIYLNCKKMADTLLIKIENKKVYDGESNEFEREQETYRKIVKEELVRCHENIVSRMVKLYSYFSNSGNDIYDEWWSFVDHVERKIDQSLRLTVKRSLQRLLNSINGIDSDKTTEGNGGLNRNPLFLVRVDLKEENEDEVNPGLTPNIKELMTMVTGVNGETTKVVTIVPRLKNVLKGMLLEQVRKERPEDDKIDPHLFVPEEGSTNYYDKNIEIDPDIIKSIVSIMEGMDAITSRVTDNLNEWKDAFKIIWSVDKDNFIRRFGIPHNRTAKSFEQEIEKYKQYHQDIQNKDPTMYIGYLQLDFMPLKQTLFMECNLWQSKLLDLLHTNSKKELDKNYELFEKNGKLLREEPRNLETLEKKMELVSRMETEYPKKKAGFAPLYDQYELLRNYDVKIDESEQENLDMLTENSNRFEELIEKAKGELENQKETFRMKLRANVDIFANTLLQLKAEFENSAPFSSQYTFKDAKAVLDAFRDKVEMKKKEEEKLKNGLRIFNMQPQQYKEIKDVSKNIESLEKVWIIKNEWDKTYEEWKVMPFTKLNIEEMENAASALTSKLTAMGREVKDWGVYNTLVDKLKLISKVLPLVQELKNPAMRRRHWNELKDIIKQDFEENSKDFNFEKIFKLSLENYVDDISTISHRASQELLIEKEIKKISDIWSNTTLDIVPYKEIYFKLQSVENIYMNLDDNVASLGSMKLNPFITSFQSDVKFWEETLAKINEVIDLLILVQRQWIYLLNIFDVEDIQKQLHNEFGVFKSVNSSWKNLMKSLSDNKGIVAIAKRDGINILLTEMNAKLEQIQKQLDGYLELKRQEFPRFYFLSDDDLLQILGQSKDPNAMQRHLSNLFEGIKSLKIEKSSDSRQFGFFAKSFISKEGEHIEFNHPVPLEGNVEKWLSQIESSMKSTIKRGILKCYSALKNYSQESSRESWIKEWPGQLTHVASQLFWTKKIYNVLSKQKEPAKILKEMKVRIRAEWLEYLNSYSSLSRDMKGLDRIKIVSLMTLEIHSRDVIDRLIRAKVTCTDDFEWLKQIRYEWDEEKDGCIISQNTTNIDYGYEYIGNCSRLVITPLTERCFLALTTALQLKKGGCASGPAGTGKSETIKDLAKSVGKHTLILNCSDRFDYQSIGKTFSGIVQSGSWSCFDEFNRLELHVLSIVAQQILQILNAVSMGVDSFIFEGNDIRMNPTCGIFVTMNPNYLGRSQLPDNLKVLLRPVSMMVPDALQICEIKLYSHGFKETQSLAKKIITAYNLLDEQLSKQPHYDFGLRSISSLLNAAGELKRNQISDDEEMIVMMACKSMNLPKLLSNDIPIFDSILRDLFSNKEYLESSNPLSDAITQSLVEQNYQVSNYIMNKCIQLEETLAERHGVMLIGDTCSGKTTTWKTLQTSIPKAFKGNEIKEYVINPKSLSHDELYGNYDNFRDWRDGVFSTILREVVKDTKENKHHWIVFDGPVDTLWVESMNTLLDNSKMLTLISGDRIALSPNVRLIFEVSDVSYASPATISRCGMVFFNANELGWQSIVKSWLYQRRRYEEKIGYPSPDTITEFLNGLLFEKNYIQRTLDEKNRQTEFIHLSDIHAVKSFCSMFDALATVENGLDPNDHELYLDLIKKYLVFCLIWTIGASVDDEGRKRMDIIFREFDPQFPSSDTVYEYFIDTKTKLWKPWNERVNTSWKMHPNTPFHKLIVPTIDTVRNSFMIHSLLKANQQVLITGMPGVGKTLQIQNTLSQFDERQFTTCQIAFCARTRSSTLQQLVESKVEKSLDTFTPYAGKTMILFADDFNTPEKDDYGSQPPLELIRQYLDHGFWYDRTRNTVKKLKKVQVLAAMGPVGGGRTQISNRLLSRFNVLNITAPSDSQLNRIYSTLLSQRLEKLEEVKTLSEELTHATIGLFKSVSTYLLPTPKKIHYSFNLRDLSKVFQGLILADHESLDSKEQTLRLWVHECYRVFHDRLCEEEDRKWFRDKVGEQLSDVFGYKWKRLFSGVYDEILNSLPNTSVSFVSNHGAVEYSTATTTTATTTTPSSSSLSSSLISAQDFQDSEGIFKPTLFGEILTFREKTSYVEMTSMDALRKQISTNLAEYNEKPNQVPMKMVLFNDAIEHLCRLHRILKQQRGNALLIGIGGSGRQSLTKLVSYMLGYKLVEFVNMSSLKEFQESLKDIYWEAGFKGKEMVLLFSDSESTDHAILENMNSILSTGEVPNLFSGEEIQNIYETCKKEAMIHGGCNDLIEEVYQYFIEKVRTLLHVVSCMSPIGKLFKQRIRMYPAFIKYSTLDWYSDWPESALRQVANSFLAEIPSLDQLVIQNKEESLDGKRPSSPSLNKPQLEQQKALLDAISEVLFKVHFHAKSTSEKMKIETQRQFYVTPSHYLSFVTDFCNLLEEKRREFTKAVEDNERGVRTLENTNQAIKKMTIQLDKQHKEVDEKKKKCDNLMDHIVGRQTECNNIRGQISVEKSQIESETEKANKLSEQSRKQLSEVEPLLESAEEALKSIQANDIYEIKKYTNPPPEVLNVFNVIMVILKKSESNWEAIKNQMTNPLKFLNSLVEYPKTEMTERLLNSIHNAIEKYELNNLEKIEAVSGAVVGLAKWAIAIERYGRVYLNVKPKREALEKAEKAAQEYQLKLEKTTLALKEFEKELSELGKQYEEREKGRWLMTIQRYKNALKNLIGDVLLTCAFTSYAGPFTPSYRNELVSFWTKEIVDHSFSVSADFAIEKVLSKSTTVRDWNTHGLPVDQFSIQNGVLVMTGRKHSLMIDPQGQAKNWIKKLYEYDKMKIENAKLFVSTTFKDPKMMKLLEIALKTGTPMLIEDILEDIDPSLNCIINQSIETRSGRTFIRLGEKLVDYHPNFKLFLTTKLSNPKYSPEIASSLSIINFSVTNHGLEEQLLAILVRKEKPELEEQKTSTMISVASANKQLEMLQNEILQALTSDQSEELLENETLISNLQQSKKTSEEVSNRLEISQENEKKIDHARNQYREAATRASILYFALMDLGAINVMYQHSLESYIELFKKSIENSPKPKGRSDQQIQQRIEMLNEFHTYEFYKKTCQGLFEKHKLLFIFHLCIKLLQSEGKLNSEEYDFFLERTFH
ncbi:hypothetical protein FDP41_002371 [Naegleria fowleri]|uniref:Dynein heavy chain, cytosolic n=1 Tax=Naegleria fowleri TaxID=5763 RepID=A0A6A5BVT8_NAEFO|nr:uncharacterized protein FDP41_002371 [Naegleria fowleri]KAF0978551.1 hypothetical protein FDP41_002371 [Naegleria fowleri]